MAGIHSPRVYIYLGPSASVSEDDEEPDRPSEEKPESDRLVGTGGFSRFCVWQFMQCSLFRPHSPSSTFSFCFLAFPRQGSVIFFYNTVFKIIFYYFIFFLKLFFVMDFFYKRLFFIIIFL